MITKDENVGVTRKIFDGKTLEHVSVFKDEKSYVFKNQN